MVAEIEPNTCWYRNHVTGENQNIPENRLYITDSCNFFALLIVFITELAYETSFWAIL